MSPVSSFPSHRRLKLQSAVRVWLVWFAGALALLTGARGMLDFVARGIGALLVLRACDLVNPRGRGSPIPKRRALGGAKRAALGARMRKLLRGKRVRARIAALLGVLDHFETHARRLARRLKRGLTRRAPILAMRADEECVSLGRGAVVCVDTS